VSYKPAAQSNAPAVANALALKQKTVIDVVQKFKSQIEAALPRHLTADRITRIIVTEIRKNPLLAECDQTSLLAAIIQTAQLGLEPGSGLGHSYLIPYGKECQLIIGYQGMIELAERTGLVTVDAHVVYSTDIFNVELGTNPSIKHVPDVTSQGEVIGAYAVARYADGRFKFRWCPKVEIEKARAQSRSGKYNKGPWKDFYAEMAMKTAVRRLFKLLPKSPEILRAQVIDVQDEIGARQILPDAEEILGLQPVMEAESFTAEEKAAIEAEERET
jgi:recombination protein RecT